MHMTENGPYTGHLISRNKLFLLSWDGRLPCCAAGCTMIFPPRVQKVSHSCDYCNPPLTQFISHY